MAGLQEPFDEVLGRLRRANTDLQDVEVKAAGGGLPRTAVESVSAFANAEGGLLVLGMDEADAFRPVPIDAPKVAADLASACADQLEPPIRPEIDIVTTDDQPVVVALVDPLPVDRKPCYVKARGIERGSFLRTHDGDRALTTYEVHVLKSSHGQPQDDAVRVPGTSLADLDADLLSTLLRRLRETRGPVFDRSTDDDILRMMRIVVDGEAGTEVTLGGLLALGRYPQQYFPQLDMEVPDTGRTVCENRGTGLLVAAASLRLAGIEPPELQDRVREFRVVIRNHGLLDAEALGWLATIDTSALSDRQRLGLAFVRYCWFVMLE